MSLDAAFAIATGGLTNVSRQLGVVSQNVSNANTTGYTKEVGQQTAVDSGGQPMGVRTGITQRSVDATLQDESRQQDAAVAALDVRSTALAAIDAAHGTPGNSNDLASLTTALSDAFSTLTSTPSLASGQSGVVTAASALAEGINRVADSITTQRQSAQGSLVDEVAQLNTSLATIGTLTLQIQSGTNSGDSTATLEDQRDTAMETVAKLTGARFQQLSNGTLQVILPSGTTLPTDGRSQISISDSQVSAQTAAPSISLRGQDITSQFTDGQIGANVSLRDRELPTFQAELDEFSHNLGDRFSAAGLELFTDGSNTIAAAAAAPPVQADYLGLANRIQVNPAVSADPSLVQQGTGGASLSASDQSVITAVLDQAFGTQASSTASAPASSGLGLSGTLSTPFSSPQTLASFSSDVVSAQTGASATTQTDLDTAKTIQQNLNTKTASVSGVSVDEEMSTMINLQNSYAANARMITTIKDMWTQTLNMVSSS